MNLYQRNVRISDERTGEPVGQALAGPEQPFHFLPEVVVTFAFAFENRGTPGGGRIDCGFIHGANSTEAFRAHGTVIGVYDSSNRSSTSEAGRSRSPRD